jgi:hypothetical protein
MPPPWANLLMAFIAFFAGYIFLGVSGWAWLAALVALIAVALFQSAAIWYLVVLYVVGTLLLKALRGGKRKGPSGAPGTGILQENRTEPSAPQPAQTGAQPERIPAGGTETAWIKAEKKWGGFAAGMLGHFGPGQITPFDITLTVMASGPPGTGSVPIISDGFRIWIAGDRPVEYLQSEDLGEGINVLEQMSRDLINGGFQLVDYGPFWFQRRFEREYIPGLIDYSDNTPLEPRAAHEEEQESRGGFGALMKILLLLAGIVLLTYILLGPGFGS